MSDTHQIPVWHVEYAVRLLPEDPWKPRVDIELSWVDALNRAKDLRGVKDPEIVCVRITGPHYVTVPGKEKIRADLL